MPVLYVGVRIVGTASGELGSRSCLLEALAFLESLQVAGWNGRLWGQRIASTVAKPTLYNSPHAPFWSAKWEADGKTLWILSNANYRSATGDFPKDETERMRLYSFNRWGKMLSQRNIDIPGFKQTYHVAMTVQ